MAKGIRLIVALIVISLLSGGVLAMTYELTYPKMQQAAQEEQKKAIFEVLPGIKDYRVFKNDAGMDIYEGLDANSNVTGIAFVAKGSGFQGEIKAMVGLDLKERKITKYKVLELSETPGLGARIVEDDFSSQFSAKSLDAPFIVKNDIDAITGATISSNAITRIIKSSTDKVLEVYGGGK